MGKGRKTWAIILIAAGAFLFLMGFTAIKETWVLFIVGAIPAAIGILMLLKGKKLADAAAQKKEEETARLAAIEKEIEERTRNFWFEVADPVQEILEKVYEKQYGAKEYKPNCVVAPYADDEKDEYGCNVMVEDKKIGEVPNDRIQNVIDAINGEDQTVMIATKRSMGKDGYVYSAIVSVKYLVK